MPFCHFLYRRRFVELQYDKKTILDKICHNDFHKICNFLHNLFVCGFDEDIFYNVPKNNILNSMNNTTIYVQLNTVPIFRYYSCFDNKYTSKTRSGRYSVNNNILLNPFHTRNIIRRQNNQIVLRACKNLKFSKRSICSNEMFTHQM